MCAVGGDGLVIGRAVEISVRPEVIRLRVANGTANGPSAGLRGRVEQAAYLGATFSYVVHSTGGLDLTAHAPKSDGRMVVGTEVDIEWRPEDALVLAGRPTGAATLEEDAP
jgi:ABC-type Fe3+/spermidine/putrescine transport system ATPase subunit